MQSLVNKLNFEDYTLSEEKIDDEIQKIISKECWVKCNICRAICTSTEKEHVLHKSDFHAYPALGGWCTKGMLKNDATCEGIVYNDWMIEEGTPPYPINARVYFEKVNWTVE